jgi:hypothetical protein
MRARRIVDCPGCGKPLAKDTSKCKYYCENDGCKVIFVQHPFNSHFTKISYKPSTSKKTINRIEKNPIKIRYR